MTEIIVLCAFMFCVKATYKYLKKFEYHEKVVYFCCFFCQSVQKLKLMYSKLITYEVKLFKPLFFVILMVMDYKYWKN